MRPHGDEWPAGVAATVVWKDTVEGVYHPSWRPMNHSSRVNTTAEMNEHRFRHTYGGDEEMKAVVCSLFPSLPLHMGEGLRNWGRLEKILTRHSRSRRNKMFMDSQGRDIRKSTTTTTTSLLNPNIIRDEQLYYKKSHKIETDQALGVFPPPGPGLDWDRVAIRVIYRQ